jgi:competence ComEA-like helix-hairpin-helix protein
MLIFKRLLALCTQFGQTRTCFGKPFYLFIYKSFAKLLSLLIASNLLICCAGVQTKQTQTAQNSISTVEHPVNINTANAEELEKLPRVGKLTARKIVEYRERFGAFRKPEHLILVDGISDAEFREMKNFVSVR